MSDTVSESFSKSVYTDGIEATKSEGHACWPMYKWQHENGHKLLQLPEPFSGAKATLNIAFIGLNPSISGNEEIPTVSADWDFEKYDRYYRERFSKSRRDSEGKLCIKENDGALVPVKLWNNIERFGKDYLSDMSGGDFQLGEHAILIEAIRYKSTKVLVGGNKREKVQISEDQSEFTQKLIDEGVFSILLPMGNGALNQIRGMLNFEQNVPNRIMKAMGNSYVGKTRAGRLVTVCPIKHMSYHAKRDMKIEVSRRISEAFISRK